jgi:hypothetical protein
MIMNPTKVRAGINATTLGITFAALLVSASLAQARLLAQWSFEDYSGSVVHDSTAAFPGTLSATGAAIVTGGVSGNALSLSRAANGFVNMGNVLGLTSGDFSLVAWIKLNPGDRTQHLIILGKHNGGSRNGYYLNVNGTGGLVANDKVLFYQGLGGGPMTFAETPVSTTSVNDGNWHQIVAVYKANGEKSIYVDGAPAESVKPSQAFVGNSEPFLLGAVSWSGVPDARFTGLIDEVQVYNHALTAGDVDFLYQNPTQIVLDCEQVLADTQAQLAAANAAIAQLQEYNEQLESEILALVRPIGRLTEHFQTVFNAPQYQIPGASAPEQLENVVTGIQKLNFAQQQALYLQLGGTRKK